MSYPCPLREPEYGTDYRVRVIRPSGEMSWRKRMLFVSEALAGQHVGVRWYEPERTWLLEFGELLIGQITRDGRFVRSTTTKKPTTPPASNPPRTCGARRRRFTSLAIRHSLRRPPHAERRRATSLGSDTSASVRCFLLDQGPRRPWSGPRRAPRGFTALASLHSLRHPPHHAVRVGDFTQLLHVCIAALFLVGPGAPTPLVGSSARSARLRRSRRPTNPSEQAPRCRDATRRRVPARRL